MENWLTAAFIDRTHLGDNLIPFLTEMGCLSHFFYSKQIPYKLEVTSQNFKPNFKRDVIIYLNSIPSIFATTQMPQESYLYFQDVLDNLHDKPIGDNLLFKYPFIRQEIKFKLLNNKQNHGILLPHGILLKEQYSLARRSIFKFKEYRISLIEVFLSSIPNAYYQN